MTEFLAAITSFPAVVFTVALAVSLCYWAVTSALGMEGGDADGGVELDGDGVGGFGALLTGLDLHLMPLSLVVTVISLVGWVITTIASLAIGVDGAVGLAVGVVTLVVALIVGVIIAGRVGQVLGPIFSPPSPPGHRDLVGRICTVRTGRVDAGFGQGEVTDADGGSHLVQIRCLDSNQLASGDRALVVDVDDGVFLVSPDVDVLR